MSLRPPNSLPRPPQARETIFSDVYSSVQFSCWVVSDSLWPHESQHARPPCPSPTPRVHSSWWCHVYSSLVTNFLLVKRNLLFKWQIVGSIVEKAMAPHSSTLAWKIPWAEEPGRLQSMGSLRVEHHWVTSLSLFTFMHWRRKWQPTPVFSPGESQGQRSPLGFSLWGRRESDTTEAT